MSIVLDLQIASNAQDIPTSSQFQAWVDAALSGHIDNTELTIRIVDEEESASLNFTYRKKSGSTNVLSFPAEIDPQFNCPLLGDIIICAPVVKSQAKEHNKKLLAHWAHMVVHGTLHLLGYNHITNDEAVIMEKLETKILVQFGYAPPYGER